MWSQKNHFKSLSFFSIGLLRRLNEVIYVQGLEQRLNNRSDSCHHYDSCQTQIFIRLYYEVNLMCNYAVGAQQGHFNHFTSFLSWVSLPPQIKRR